MSRYCGNTETSRILEAAVHWRDAALVGGGSVFTAKNLWGTTALDALDRHFVQNPDPSDRKFLEKLKLQLEPTDAATKQLAAEMMWLMYLCPSSLTVQHKVQTVSSVWSWSGEALPANSKWLSKEVLGGVGSAGPGFNQNQWRELAFLIGVTRRFRATAPEPQRELLADGWRLDEWLKQIPEWDTRQFRHMLLFLLFPDQFERIFGQNDRKAIVRHFRSMERRDVRRLDPVEIDRLLLTIREELEEKLGTGELDFYTPPLAGQWRSGSFATATEGLAPEHVRLAIAEIEAHGVPQDAVSTGYDLVYEGKRYPPKYVISIAVKHATGEPLDRSEFSGGEESSAFRLLRRLGFELAAKNGAQPSIAELVDRFLAQADEGAQLSVQGYPPEYRGLRVRVSFGQGNFARIPWIAFLGEGQSVSHGIYPVLLLFREQRRLLLCYGVSETTPPDVEWSGIGSAPSVQRWFRENHSRNPDRYGTSFVHSVYDVDEDFSREKLQAALDEMVDTYMRCLPHEVEAVQEEESNMPPDAAPLPLRANLREAVDQFSRCAQDAGVSFGARHRDLVAAFVASLATKPLAILTGMSGSGKTQIAVRFGEWLGKDRLHVAAVRPDWTGAEALFGYEDGLKPARDGLAAWSVPGPLAFILKAARDPQHPYLLLLDEMNLAHVERYFADVLSGMESGQPCLPNLSQGGDGCWRPLARGAERLPFPRNLWVVGTVNVDETTYMFSPKVLDRANTFEFRVETSDLLAEARRPSACVPGEPDLVRGLLAIAVNDAWHIEHPVGYRDVLLQRLRELHQLLSRYNLEFGHRVFYEASRFASLADEAGLSGLEAVLDRIVMQKVLPRLHGSRRRLEIPLLALAHYCRDLPEAVAADEKLQTLAPEQLTETAPRLPIAHAKVARMLWNLRANQFASFTE